MAWISDEILERDKDFINRFGEYIRAYVQRFNELQNNAPAFLKNFPLFNKIEMSHIYRTLDGIAVFHFPQAIHEGIKYNPGVYFFQASDVGLSTFLQSVSMNLIKVLLDPTEPLKSDFSNHDDVQRIPENLPTKKMLKPLFSSDVFETLKYAPKLNFSGMAVSPVKEYKNGLVVGTIPTRVHILSPIISTPKNRKIQQYTWSSADLFWNPEEHDLSLLKANEFADADLQISRFAITANFPSSNISQDPFETVANHVHSICDEFEKILNSENVDEAIVQNFLEEDGHYFLISPSANIVYPRKQLGGKFIPDFIVQLPDKNFHLVEIENPKIPIYQQAGEEQAAHLTHAITQVEDWLRYIDDNNDTVRREDGLETIYKPTGEVVAGRNSHLGKKAQQRFDFQRAENKRINVKTFDMLVEEARSYAERLRSIKKST